MVSIILCLVFQQIGESEKQHHLVDEQRQRDLLDTQKEALAMQQTAMIETEKQQMLEHQQLVSYVHSFIVASTAVGCKCTNPMQVSPFGCSLYLAPY